MMFDFEETRRKILDEISYTAAIMVEEGELPKEATESLISGLAVNMTFELNQLEQNLRRKGVIDP